ncbi:acyl-CoA synthetase (NDP forming)/RimJ/RimL family protein N-acetyltransferase [Kineosphaera limosa]|uniref:Putative acetate--CoA ligase n=1 Tax=Kineosphaera limosa NBRC 100340 TaxID=1184609 RepID=K6VNP3_9MICO|nr:GNAT family N-acetyltransferase [Kineosphaera limosa]NYD98965.1 acyl-CoA synthetase (NDP forming)/RimJ/RimL family protein N-acetyltransferase [Kineosphaera limosa]GAB97813.1 putative acetate--CoA ligase [Kineosphaera limosa NBRC 100340]
MTSQSGVALERPNTAPTPGAQTDSDDPGYPTRWVGDVVLRDGTIGHVRPITPRDAEAIHRFHEGQSEESIYLRFFAPIKRLSDRDVHRFTHVDYCDRVALVVVVGDELIGIGRYDRLDDPQSAEVAFNISDHYHGKGVGSVLLEHLAAIAQENDITKFVADVLPQNRKMMKVFTDAGYEVRHHYDDGVISVEFTIEPTDRSQAVQLSREHRSEAQSMAAVLSPKSIAVVGLSRRPDAFGSQVVDNILDAGYTGPVYVVHSEADTVRGLPTYKSVASIGEPIDMAVIAVPAESVSAVVDDCAQAGVRTLLVFSVGFAEAGPEGAQLQADLLAQARRAGMRIVGPGSFGLVNNDPQVRLNATISADLPHPGTLGLFSQSGGLGVGLIASMIRAHLGLSAAVSAGNRVDVSTNDVMQYFIDDDKTKTVAIYLESVGNPRKFSRIARQLSLRKPTVVVKSPTVGRVPPGHRARASRVDPTAFDALLDQAGVIPTDTIRELTHVCQLVAQQPLPEGDGVAILGTSAGLNAITAEAAAQAGLRVVGEPVPLPTGYSPREIAEEVEAAFARPGVDMVSVTLVAPLATNEEEVARAIAHIAGGTGKPCVTAFVGTRDVSRIMRKAGKLLDRRTGERQIVPVYETPLDGINALAKASRYAAWKRSDHGERIRPSGVNRGAVDAIVQRVLDGAPEGRDLSPQETTTLLAAYGIDVWPTIPVATAQEAVEAAQELGMPVVLRSLIESVRFRPGAGGESNEETTPEGIEEAFESMKRRLAAFGDPRLVLQRTAPPGIATMISSTEDPLFGPVVSFALADPGSELLGDVSHRIPPLTDSDIRALVEGLRSSPLLFGHRGSAPVDYPALENIIGRVAALADDVPEISRLVLEHVNARRDGVDVLRARVHVAPAATRTDAGRRAMN